MDPTLTQSPAQSGVSFLLDSSYRKLAFDIFTLVLLFIFLGLGEWILEKAFGLSITKVIDNAEEAFNHYIDSLKQFDNNGGIIKGDWKPAVYIFIAVWLGLIYLVSGFTPH